MKTQIKSWYSGSILFETDAKTIGGAVLTAIAANANLSGADLSGANLRKKDLEAILAIRTILPDGDLIGWKKVQEGVICKLEIPAKAKRIGGLVGRKCRAEFAKVLEGSGKAIHNGMEYKEGQTVHPDKFDPNPLVECSNGIHFFITKSEAEAYT